MKTTNQLHLLMHNFIKNGINCCYLCRDINNTEYCLKLMLSLYRYNDLSYKTNRIYYKKAFLNFASSNRDDIPRFNTKVLIVVDHAAINSNKSDLIAYLNAITHNNDRILNDKHS